MQLSLAVEFLNTSQQELKLNQAKCNKPDGAEKALEKYTPRAVTDTYS